MECEFYRYKERDRNFSIPDKHRWYLNSSWPSLESYREEILFLLVAKLYDLIYANNSTKKFEIHSKIQPLKKAISGLNLFQDKPHSETDVCQAADKAIKSKESPPFSIKESR